MQAGGRWGPGLADAACRRHGRCGLAEQAGGVYMRVGQAGGAGRELAGGRGWPAPAGAGQEVEEDLKRKEKKRVCPTKRF
jgi:hypothetical protein